MQQHPTDLETVKAAVPYLRSLGAFAIYLRQADQVRQPTIAECYSVADQFIVELLGDLGRAEAEAEK